MDFLLNNEMLIGSLMQYGSISLFVLLVFGIIALPIPEETLMILAGILIKKGKLVLLSTLGAAYLGSICGITLSYLLGLAAGKYLIARFEKKASVKKRLDQVHIWFERFGKWTLLIGYFIPGIRHFTGFSAGAMKMEGKKFAFFAYAGAVIWVSLCISIGFFFGNSFFSFLGKIELNTTTVVLFISSIAFVYFIFSRLKSILVKS
ncbi:MAG: DedA family protein [Verrucomicrobia bacterium]|nr:DedA family protein [Verrucomicrobiota bacterium]